MDAENLKIQSFLHFKLSCRDTGCLEYRTGRKTFVNSIPFAQIIYKYIYISFKCLNSKIKFKIKFIVMGIITNLLSNDSEKFSMHIEMERDRDGERERMIKQMGKMLTIGESG